MSSLKQLIADLVPIIALPLVIFNAFLLHGAPLEAIVGDSLRVWAGNGTPVFDFLSALVSGQGIPAWSASFSRPHFNLTSELAPIFQTLLLAWTGDFAVAVRMDTFIHLIAGSVGMYFLSRFLFRDAFAAWISAVLYMFLPFNIAYLQAEMGRAWGPMLAPFGYLVLLKLLWKPSWAYGFAAALVFGAATLTHPENMFLNGIFLGLMALLVLIFRPGLGVHGTRPQLQASLLGLLVMLGLFIGLWGFHLIFSVLHENPFSVVESVENWLTLKAPPSQEAVRQSQPLLSALRLENWEWRSTPITAGVAAPFENLWFVPGILFFVYALRNRKNRWVWIWAILGAVSLWMVLGARAKPSLFTWCHYHLPFFSMARHPDRFLSHACMAFTLFSGVSISRWLTAGLGRFPRMKRPAGCLVLAPFVLAGYLFGTQYAFTFIPVERPAFVEAIREWLNKNNITGHRVLNGSGMPRLDTISFKTHFLADEILLRFYAKPYFADLAADLGFKYVVLGNRNQEYRKMFGKRGFMPDRADDEKDGDDPMEYFSNYLERKMVTDALLQNADFTAHRPAGTRDVVIFENRKADFAYELYPGIGMMTVGGPGAYDIYSYPDVLRRTTVRPIPLFLAQRRNAVQVDQLAQASDTLLFHNSGPIDLWAALEQDSIRFLDSYEVLPEDWEIGFHLTGLPQFNPTLPRMDHGYLNQLLGNHVYSRFAAVTKKADRSIRFSFTLAESGPQEILLRAYHSPGAGPLEVWVDNTPRATRSFNRRFGFWWTSLGVFDLSAGSHELVFKTQKDGLTVIDGVVVEPPGKIQAALSETVNLFPGLRDVYLVTAAQFVPTASDTARSWVHTRRKARFRADIYGNEPFLLEIDGAAVQEGVDTVLEAGLHELEIQGPIASFRHMVLEQIVLAPGGWLKNFSYKRLSADAYSWEAQVQHPFLLMQPETYFSGWEGAWAGERIEPLVSHFFLNAYPVHTTGKVKGRIRYRNRTLWGLSIFSGALLATVLVILGVARFRRIRKI